MFYLEVKELTLGVLQMGFVDILKHLLNMFEVDSEQTEIQVNAKKMTNLILSNICACAKDIKEMISRETTIIQYFLKCLEDGNVALIKETIWCVANLLTNSSFTVSQNLVGSDYKLLKILFELLDRDDEVQILDHSLECIYRIIVLRGDEQKDVGVSSNVNMQYFNSVYKILESYADKVEDMCNHPNQKIFKQAQKVLCCYTEVFCETSPFNEGEDYE